MRRPLLLLVIVIAGTLGWAVLRSPESRLKGTRVEDSPSTSPDAASDDPASADPLPEKLPNTTLPPRQVVRGRVLRHDGKPAVGARIQYSPAPNESARVRVDGEGRFRIPVSGTPASIKVFCDGYATKGWTLTPGEN